MTTQATDQTTKKKVKLSKFNTVAVFVTKLFLNFIDYFKAVVFDLWAHTCTS